MYSALSAPTAEHVQSRTNPLARDAGFDACTAVMEIVSWGHNHATLRLDLPLNSKERALFDANTTLCNCHLCAAFLTLDPYDKRTGSVLRQVIAWTGRNPDIVKPGLTVADVTEHALALNRQSASPLTYGRIVFMLGEAFDTVLTRVLRHQESELSLHNVMMWTRRHVRAQAASLQRLLTAQAEYSLTAYELDPESLVQLPGHDRINGLQFGLGRTEWIYFAAAHDLFRCDLCALRLVLKADDSRWDEIGAQLLRPTSGIYWGAHMLAKSTEPHAAFVIWASLFSRHALTENLDFPFRDEAEKERFAKHRAESSERCMVCCLATFLPLDDPRWDTVFALLDLTSTEHGKASTAAFMPFA